MNNKEKIRGILDKFYSDSFDRQRHYGLDFQNWEELDRTLQQILELTDLKPLDEKEVEKIIIEGAYNHSSNTYLYTMEDIRKIVEKLCSHFSKPDKPFKTTELLECFDIEEAVNEYELRGDNGDYIPTDDEKFLIKDCCIGIVEEGIEKIISRFFKPTIKYPAIGKEYIAMSEVANNYVSLAEYNRVVEELETLKGKPPLGIKYCKHIKLLQWTVNDAGHKICVNCKLPIK